MAHIGFDDDYDFPPEMPFGGRRGPVTETVAVVLPATDSGTLRMTVQVHDSLPRPVPGEDGGPRRR
ncbi:hypothetical protein J2Z21_008767 [Streptomyces griseochromogenes]|uniref:Uncharacterized protein n=1 Tax=Streptomyces griseochromogenes TaxID=68214 RepID=A0A1B1B0J3_9ACTN|nr:hypothetical protein [Streptomyces griseochromogenes]ANP52334.1 hypothetical protein AVL59_24805 [Streptomyces griseochromogenes]MBP2055751.1 hypothetical protein [Streptomyces griseochromogenes]